MAGRRNKNKVDYFPHYVQHGKTIFILERKFGNDGYACLFKIFELIGDSKNHFYDCRNKEAAEFMYAKIGCEENLCIQILNTIANLDVIHKELWENRVIWSQAFIENIQDVYKRRKDSCMHFLDLCKHLSINCVHDYDINGNIVNRKQQSKVKESKAKERKGKYIVEIEKIIEYLNLIVGSNYKTSSKKNIDFIISRLNENFSVEDFKTVIDKKYREWGNDPHWSKFLRPETLFGNKFESYLNQIELKSSGSMQMDKNIQTAMEWANGQ